MGFHYARVGLLDAIVNPVEPEALLYEPQNPDVSCAFESAVE